MARMSSSAVEFENLVRALLLKTGVDVEANVRTRNGRVREIDAIVHGTEGRITPVEIKLGVGPRTGLRTLRDLAAQTASLESMARNSRPLLVLGSTLDGANRRWASDEFRIDIWDRGEIIARAGNLADAIQALFDTRDALFEDVANKLLPVDTQLAPALVVEAPPSTDEAELLIDRLDKIKPGRDGAAAYERICQDIIAYLFGEDLLDGRSQRRTEDRLNIFDLIYRVRHERSFWVTLTRDFRARVVLFECKNYTNPVKPAQVFMTERYLSTGVLRPICFVLTRKPPSKEAIAAASGAMRESGKLLVFLSDDDLKEMIRIRAAQLTLETEAERRENDPTEVLDQRIYEFIAGIGR